MAQASDRTRRFPGSAPLWIRATGKLPPCLIHTEFTCHTIPASPEVGVKWKQ
jgi:hypothetical protein